MSEYVKEISLEWMKDCDRLQIYIDIDLEH